MCTHERVYNCPVSPGDPRREAREAFGRAIERLRKGRMTQAQFGEAVRANLGRGTKWGKRGVISELESGKTYVAIEDVITFAAVLNVRPGDLLVAWAEQLGPEDVAGALLVRAHTLAALNQLSDTVRQATSELLVSSGHKPGAVQEMSSLAAELMVMPKSQRKLLFKLVGALQGKEEES